MPAANIAMPATARLRPGDPNTFTGSDGRTHSVPYDVANSVPPVVPSVRRLDPVFAPPSTAPQVQDVTQRTLNSARGAAIDARNDAAEILNPLSTSGELLRRLEISQGGFKGSPSARRAMAEALTGQIGAQNAASSIGQAAANQALQQGAQAENVANETYARRRLDADQFNVGSELDRAVLDAKARRPSEAIPLIRSLDGRTSLVREDGSAETLRDEAGNPIQTIAAGGITEKDLFEARNSEIRAVQENSFRALEDRARQLREIDERPEYQRILRRLSKPESPALAEFLPRARKQNPGMADAVLIEFYNKRYGGGNS
ncbi:hypothetical protein FCE95_07690 [Luteimonas gilva]|uniref:Uncharacterized protein n=1 Tax=Luteimonas gilva TaxID=2572684 RepID=A0A4U5JY75_9GAMM|nr:hypothetical protein [Luteimonas gilva]TKR34136.1 hypothetical protein FCE95_07690 [Luteimonas gilva]